MTEKSYKLGRRFSDGRGTVHPVGAVLSFEEGKQPRTAKEVDPKAKPEPKKEPKKAPETLSEIQKSGKAVGEA